MDGFVVTVPETLAEEPVVGIPVSEDCTLAIVALSAPNEATKERMAWTWAFVSEAADAAGAKRNALTARAAKDAGTALVRVIFIELRKRVTAARPGE